MATTYPCVVCNLEVRPRQHALQCDDCDRWQHRVHCTPVQEYRMLSRRPDIQWKCSECLNTTTPTPVPYSVAEFIPDNLAEISAPMFKSIRNTSALTIVAPVPSSPDVQPREITYTVFQEGSQMGKRKLVESTGFAYVVKEKKKDTTYWVCSVRKSNQSRCLATVIEKSGVFSRGKRDHIHPACPGLFAATTVGRAVKEMARRDIFRPASTIVEQVLSDHMDERQPCPSLPAPVNLARQANRARQRMRPAQRMDLDFEVPISDKHTPDDFLQRDVRAGDYRHLANLKL